MVNKAAFDGQPAEVQKAIRDAAAAAMARGWKASEELNEGYKKTMAEKGMKVLQPSAKMISDVKEIGGTMATEWAKRAGADGDAVLAAFRK